MTLGAIFQCYNQPFATYKTLESFRRVYPTGHIVAINDGAPEELKPTFEAIAHHFNIDYTYESRRSFVADEDGAGGAARIHMNKKEQIQLYAERFAWSVARLEEPYFVILEDDVLVMREANARFWKYDINGCNPNVSFGAAAVAYLENVRRMCAPSIVLPLPKPAHYGACGGCVLNTAFFKRACLKIEAAMSDFCNVVPQSQWAGDTFISFLCYSAGGTIGVNPEFCETWYQGWFDRVVLGKVAFLHKIKVYYTQPMPDALQKVCASTRHAVEPAADADEVADNALRTEVFELIKRS